MSLLKLRWTLWDQTLHRRFSKRKISLKDFANARDATSTLARRIKNLWIRLAKKHIQISINKLRDRKQIVSQFIHKSDIIQGEVVIYLDDTGTKHFTFLAVPNGHILLMWQGSEAREPFLVSNHGSWATGIHEPCVLHSSVHHIGFRVEDIPWRFAHEAKASEVTFLALGLLILFWARVIFTREVEVAQGSTRLGHDLLKLLHLLVSETVLLAVALVTVVVPIGVVVLVRGVELLPLGAVDDEVGGVPALKATPRWPPPLLVKLVQGAEFLASKAILSSEMLSYCSSEATAKKDMANSKVDEIVVVGLASWPPTRALVIKALLVKEASWFERPLRDNPWDLSLLNNFSMSKVAKLEDSSKAVIFIPHTWSSRAYNNCLACSLLE
jgi:hypothetical protein